jgi:streptogramin lyase
MRKFVETNRIVHHQGSILILLLAMAFTSGCGGAGVTTTTTTTGTSGVAGKVVGGQFPVEGAEIQLYAAGSTGYGTGATALLSPAITTNSSGDFSVTNYTCPSSSAETYFVATGGDPGLGSDNPYITLMAALGPCGQLASIPFVVINEATTAASVWALARFLGPDAQIGTSSTNAQGLNNAFANVNNLVNITTGTSPGASVPSGAVIPVAKLYSLANILAYCVNSTGSTACDALFNVAEPPSGSAPADTLDAALDIAKNPSHNVSALFDLPSPQQPFGPSLSGTPNDWTLALTFKGGGLDLPTSIAVDASGDVWVASYCSSNSACSSVAELSPAGEPLSPSSGFTNSPDTLWESYGLAIDPSNNIWVTNQQTSGGGNGNVAEISNSGQVGSSFSGGGMYFPVAVAADSDGSIWTANQGDSTATKLENNGTAISGGSGWGSGQLSGPSGVAIDANHFAWFSNQDSSSGSVTSISSNGSAVNVISSGGEAPTGIATDSIGTNGHVWVANYSSSSISEVQLSNNGTGSVVSSGYTGGGLNHPNGIAVDGSGSVWVSNYIGNSVTELQGANGTNPGQAVSPSSGFATDASLLDPYGVAVDSSGNLWLSSYGSSTVTQLLGVAAPVKTPLVGPPQVP